MDTSTDVENLENRSNIKDKMQQLRTTENIMSEDEKVLLRLRNENSASPDSVEAAKAMIELSAQGAPQLHQPSTQQMGHSESQLISEMGTQSEFDASLPDSSQVEESIEQSNADSSDNDAPQSGEQQSSAITSGEVDLQEETFDSNPDEPEANVPVIALGDVRIPVGVDNGPSRPPVHIQNGGNASVGSTDGARVSTDASSANEEHGESENGDHQEHPYSQDASAESEHDDTNDDQELANGDGSSADQDGDSETTDLPVSKPQNISEDEEDGDPEDDDEVRDGGGNDEDNDDTGDVEAENTGVDVSENENQESRNNDADDSDDEDSDDDEEDADPGTVTQENEEDAAQASAPTTKQKRRALDYLANGRWQDEVDNSAPVAGPSRQLAARGRSARGRRSVSRSPSTVPVDFFSAGPGPARPNIPATLTRTKAGAPASQQQSRSNRPNIPATVRRPQPGASVSVEQSSDNPSSGRNSSNRSFAPDNHSRMGRISSTPIKQVTTPRRSKPISEQLTYRGKGPGGRRRKAKDLQEIKFFQKKECPMLLKASFGRLVREVVQGQCKDRCDELRMQASALLVLQHASEDLLTEYFEHSQLLASHANRVTVMQKDMRTLRLTCGFMAPEYMRAPETYEERVKRQTGERQQLALKRMTKAKKPAPQKRTGGPQKKKDSAIKKKK